jgi:hypothetical protein
LVNCNKNEIFYFWLRLFDGGKVAEGLKGAMPKSYPIIQILQKSGPANAANAVAGIGDAVINEFENGKLP